jgi:hypothetical protein
MRLLGFVAAAGFVIATATPASANCSPNKTAATFGVGFTSVYWTPAGGVNEGTLTGQFWQLGNRGAGNEGACNVAGVPTFCSGPDGPWLYFYAGKVNMSAVMGSAGVAACPSSMLITTAQVNSTDGKETFFLAGTVAENNSVAPDYNYTTLGDHGMVPIPRPRVLSQSRAAGQVTLQINIPSPAAGAFGPAAASAITGYRLVSGNGVGANDPGREAVAYPTTLQSFTGTGPQTVSQIIDCTGIVLPNEKYIGVQILFADGQVSRVGGSYRVGCDPAIAQPKTPIVPKKGPGVRQIQN